MQYDLNLKQKADSKSYVFQPNISIQRQYKPVSEMSFCCCLVAKSCLTLQSHGMQSIRLPYIRRLQTRHHHLFLGRNRSSLKEKDFFTLLKCNYVGVNQTASGCVCNSIIFSLLCSSCFNLLHCLNWRSGQIYGKLMLWQSCLRLTHQSEK